MDFPRPGFLLCQLGFFITKFDFYCEDYQSILSAFSSRELAAVLVIITPKSAYILEMGTINHLLI
jgi:hypothetical protein